MSLHCHQLAFQLRQQLWLKCVKPKIVWSHWSLKILLDIWVHLRVFHLSNQSKEWDQRVQWLARILFLELLLSDNCKIIFIDFLFSLKVFKLSHPSIKNPVGFSIFVMAAESNSRTTELLTKPPIKKLFKVFFLNFKKNYLWSLYQGVLNLKMKKLLFC